jgi:hypothetical protein
MNYCVVEAGEILSEHADVLEAMAALRARPVGARLVRADGVLLAVNVSTAAEYLRTLAKFARAA